MKFLRKIKWSDVRILLVLMILMSLYSFTNKNNEVRKIADIKVQFLGDGDPFITSQNVSNLLIQSFPKTSNINKTNLDLNNLELMLQNHEMIKNAEIYTTVDGKLRADVWQKRAIGRLVYKGESCYIDSEGYKIPLSSVFSARVPIVDGLVNENNRSKVADVLTIIDKDDFLKKNITGIAINFDQTLTMRSRKQKFKIFFGGFENSKIKFENFKAFLHFVSNDQELVDSYKSINLKFTQQVVCTK